MWSACACLGSIIIIFAKSKVFDSKSKLKVDGVLSVLFAFCMVSFIAFVWFSVLRTDTILSNSVGEAHTHAQL